MTTGPLSPSLASLAAQWLERAAHLRAYGAEGQALTLEHASAELRGALATADAESLTLEQAAAESGFSADHLRHLVASGALPNAGRKGAPRIARGALPKKPGKAAPRAAYDADEDALALMRPGRVG